LEEKNEAADDLNALKGFEHVCTYYNARFAVSVHTGVPSSAPNDQATDHFFRPRATDRESNALSSFSRFSLFFSSSSPSSSFSFPQLTPPEISRRQSKSTVTTRQRPATIEIDHYQSILGGNVAEKQPQSAVPPDSGWSVYRSANRPVPSDTVRIANLAIMNNPKHDTSLLDS
ncbi:hypothetical protein B296_00038064, partial [Ensete ventricosum]